MNFNEKCYELIKQVPKGKVTSYKEISKALGTKAYRAVGTAMKNNKDLVNTPCHRVVRADGDLGEYVEGKVRKQELLEEEGVQVKDGKIVFFETILHHF